MDGLKGPNQQYGSEGEDLAKAYLQKKGWRCLASNFKTHWGEIDLIMEDKETVVFVEVKRRRSADFGQPEEAVNLAKRKHLVRSAIEYVQRQPKERSIRFDVVSISPKGIVHFQDAFMVDENFYY